SGKRKRRVHLAVRDESLLQLRKKFPSSGTSHRWPEAQQPGEFCFAKRKDKPSDASVYLFDTTAKPSLRLALAWRRAPQSASAHTHAPI
ncbi:hypothetical protein, partial [Acutalibacter sp. 1XD8-33]|uniref:hypothetical protein n=1 Tax=Acutalibacter sp. 1XD8-33 TaxID=2320081 RepID=UPI001A9BE085